MCETPAGNRRGFFGVPSMISSLDVEVLYGYTWFRERFVAYQRRANLTFRHSHAAGAVMQTDHAGPTVEIIDPQTGEIRQA